MALEGGRAGKAAKGDRERRHHIEIEREADQEREEGEDPHETELTREKLHRTEIERVSKSVCSRESCGWMWDRSARRQQR